MQLCEKCRHVDGRPSVVRCRIVKIVEREHQHDRIDPAIVVAAMTAAGFELDGQSDLLRNAEDDYEKVVFDPGLRGKTDRFVMRFRKPE